MCHPVVLWPDELIVIKLLRTNPVGNLLVTFVVGKNQIAAKTLVALRLVATGVAVVGCDN